MQEMQPFFLDLGSDRGRRLCIYHPPLGERRGQVLHIHAFAEEMNKSRRMAALQARAMASAGFAVLQIDLLGCGDSSGDFGDANWNEWLVDLEAAAAWLNSNASGPLLLWGQRAGCLLACELARRLNQPCSFLFWQPPAQGKLLLQQFLRLKVAAGMQQGSSPGAMKALKDELATGHSVEVAGYVVAPSLAHGLEQARLIPPARAGSAHWIELSSQAGAEPMPATQDAAQAWRDAGISVVLEVAQGPAFWQTSEIEDAPALLAASLRGLAGLAGVPA